MARFYVTASGQSSETSRIGSPGSGIHTHARGWNVGVAVHGRVEDDDTDVFYIYATGGSNGRHSDELIGRVTLVDGAVTFDDCRVPA